MKNNNMTQKRIKEYKSSAIINTPSEDFFLKSKKTREATSEVKTSYNNTYQNFFKPNVKKIYLLLAIKIDRSQ